MSMDDNDGQMIFGDRGGLKLPDICLTGEEKPRKTSPRKLVPTGDRTRARCVTSAHATTCSTAVDPYVQEWVHTQPKNFWEKGIKHFPKRWKKCIEANGRYFEG